MALGEKPGFVMTIIRQLLLKNVYVDGLEADAIIQLNEKTITPKVRYNSRTIDY